MKQIGNWVFGSFFRTIGRLLVFILLGIIIANIIDFGSLKDSFSITDLFFDKVNASSLVPHDMGNITTSGWGNPHIGWGIYKDIALQTGTLYNENNNFTIENGILGSNINEVHISGYIYGIDYTKDKFECDYLTSNGCETWSLSNSAQLEFKLWAGGWSSPCKIEIDNTNMDTIDTLYFNATCPYNRYLLDTFYYRIKYTKLSSTGAYWLGINKFAYLLKDTQQETTNAIESQTQQQQQQHEEVMDSNTTEAEEEASSFFEDFDAPDIGGLGAIITAPLNTIRSLLNSSCTNLVLPLPFVNENLTLPCMNTIYTEHFGAFFSIYQTIILAIIAYRCIRSIFFDIHGFTNPNDDRIEVMDL